MVRLRLFKKLTKWNWSWNYLPRIQNLQNKMYRQYNGYGPFSLQSRGFQFHEYVHFFLCNILHAYFCRVKYCPLSRKISEHIVKRHFISVFYRLIFVITSINWMWSDCKTSLKAPEIMSFELQTNDRVNLMEANVNIILNVHKYILLACLKVNAEGKV